MTQLHTEDFVVYNEQIHSKIFGTPMWDALLSWLDANNIDRIDVPLWSTIKITHSRVGRPWIQYTAYKHNKQGARYADKNGNPVIEQCEAMMAVDLPLAWRLDESSAASARRISGAANRQHD